MLAILILWFCSSSALVFEELFEGKPNQAVGQLLAYDSEADVLAVSASGYGTSTDPGSVILFTRSTITNNLTQAATFVPPWSTDPSFLDRSPSTNDSTRFGFGLAAKYSMILVTAWKWTETMPYDNVFWYSPSRNGNNVFIRNSFLLSPSHTAKGTFPIGLVVDIWDKTSFLISEGPMLHWLDLQGTLIQTMTSDCGEVRSILSDSTLGGFGRLIFGGIGCYHHYYYSPFLKTFERFGATPFPFPDFGTNKMAFDVNEDVFYTTGSFDGQFAVARWGIDYGGGFAVPVGSDDPSKKSVDDPTFATQGMAQFGTIFFFGNHFFNSSTGVVASLPDGNGDIAYVFSTNEPQSGFGWDIIITPFKELIVSAPGYPKGQFNGKIYIADLRTLGNPNPRPEPPPPPPLAPQPKVEPPPPSPPLPGAAGTPPVSQNSPVPSPPPPISLTPDSRPIPVPMPPPMLAPVPVPVPVPPPMSQIVFAGNASTDGLNQSNIKVTLQPGSLLTVSNNFSLTNGVLSLQNKSQVEINGSLSLPGTTLIASPSSSISVAGCGDFSRATLVMAAGTTYSISADPGCTKGFQTVTTNTPLSGCQILETSQDSVRSSLVVTANIFENCGNEPSGNFPIWAIILIAVVGAVLITIVLVVFLIPRVRHAVFPYRPAMERV